MSAGHYFDYLGTVWSLLPTEDQERMGELWKGYEQVFTASFQKLAEVNLNIAVKDLQTFDTERWLPYTFTTANFLSRAATITSTQDISVGLNLSARYLLRFSIDGGAPIEVNIQGVNPLTTTIDEIIPKINLGAGPNFARAIFENTVVQLVSPTTGVGSTIELLPTSIPGANASEFVLGIDAGLLPKTFPEFRYPYLVPYSRVRSIPEFRDKIRDDNVGLLLAEGTDYIVEEPNIVTFAAEPPAMLWARRSLVDAEVPWNNFGFLLNIYDKNSIRYTNVVQGLWFAFWNGPKPINVKKSLYLLFGLPVAAEACTVTSVSPTEVVTTSAAGVVRTFEVPPGLNPIVVVGQELIRFDPLVDGIQVFDKINYPGFIEAEIGRDGIGRFLTDEATRGPGDTDETKALTMLEEYTFLPQISVESFIYPDINLGNVKIFLDAIKPLNKTYLFQVIIGAFRDELALEEHVALDIGIDVTPSLDSNETTFIAQADLDSYETIDNDALNLDPHGILFQESVEIEVRSFSILIDSFTA